MVMLRALSLPFYVSSIREKLTSIASLLTIDCKYWIDTSLAWNFLMVVLCSLVYYILACIRAPEMTARDLFGLS